MTEIILVDGRHELGVERNHPVEAPTSTRPWQLHIGEDEHVIRARVTHKEVEALVNLCVSVLPDQPFRLLEELREE